MTPPNPDLDVLQTLARREDVLSRLEDDPCRKRDLVSDLGVSRSTVDRAVRELEWFDFVERRDGSYGLTAAGRLALSEHRRRADTLEAIADASDLLRDVPCDAPLSACMLDGATIHEPKPHAPNEPLEAIADLLGTADRFRGFVAADRIPQYRERLYDRTVNGDLDAEVLVTDDLVDFLLDAHREQLREAVADGGFGLYSLPSVPYGLCLVETPHRSRAFVVVLGVHSEIRGIVENDSTAALRWADETYRRFRAAATPLEPPT